MQATQMHFMQLKLDLFRTIWTKFRNWLLEPVTPFPSILNSISLFSNPCVNNEPDRDRTNMAGLIASHPNNSTMQCGLKWILRKHSHFLTPVSSQLPGRLFSPSDICKKLSHHFLLHLPIGMGSYDHHAKYQGVFP